MSAWERKLDKKFLKLDADLWIFMKKVQDTEENLKKVAWNAATNKEHIEEMKSANLLYVNGLQKQIDELKDTVESVKKLNQYRDKRINETIKDIFELKEQYSALMIEWKTTEEAYGQLHDQIDELKELMRSNDNHRGQEITNLEGVLRELIMITTQGNNYKRLIENLGGRIYDER